MRVLHIAPTPFFADRGCHIRIRNEIEAFKASDVKIILCTYPIGRDIEGIDIRRTFRIPGFIRTDAGFSPFRFPADVLVFFLTLKVAWQERPDILHGHLHEGALIGWAVRCCLFWRKIPLVMDMQGSLTGELIGYGTIPQTSFLARVSSVVEQIICRMPKAFFCSSVRSLGILRQRHGVDHQRLALVNDVVPDRFFTVQDPAVNRTKLGIPADRTVVLYSGSLLPGKGVGHILQAIDQLRSMDLYWLLIGYPIEDIHDQLMALSLDGMVRMTGQVAYDDLSQWLAVADIALDPKEDTSGEASGKILHYMAAGLPVVCFDTVNNRSLLGTLGYYADTSENAFSRAILAAVHEHPTERARRGAEGRTLASRDYSLASIRNNLARQYRLLTEGDRAGQCP